MTSADEGAPGETEAEAGGARAERRADEAAAGAAFPASLLAGHDPLALPFRVETFGHLPSTQDEARRRLDRGDDVHGLVIRALEQSAGRGQRARDWSSGRGGSWQTLGVRDARPPVLDRSWAALAVGIGLARILPEYGIQIALKWPNDLLYRGRKLGGILVERARGHLLIGVGVNVENDVPDGAAALRGLDPEGVSGMVLAGVQTGLELLAGGLDDGQALPGAFAPFDALAGEPVRLELDGEAIEGEGAGVDALGRLRVRRGNAVVLVGGDPRNRGAVRIL